MTQVLVPLPRLVLAALVLATACAHAADSASFTFDDSGQLTAIAPASGEPAFSVAEALIRIRTDLGEVTTAGIQPSSTRSDGEARRSEYRSGDFVLTVTWRPGKGFVERTWTLAHTGKQPFRVEDVVESIAFGEPFERIDLHTDGSAYRVPINLFLRRRGMSLGVGVTYPWTELRRVERNGAEVRYDVGVDVPAGDRFDSERFFVVACPYVGAICDKGGGETRVLLLNESEPMDYGEVWAMQDYVAHYAPEQPLPEDGYWVWLNGWWARGAQTWDPVAVVDRVADWGIHDIMTPEVWWGYGEHPVNIPALSALEPGESLPLPEPAQDLVAYARTKGVHIGSFCCPSIAYFDRTDWRSVRKDGTPYTYLGDIGKPGYDCWAIDDFIEAFTELQAGMIEASGGRFWAWDGRTMSFSEVDGIIGEHDAEEQYRPLPCHGDGHGHPAGRQFYREFHNIQRMIADLRKEFPRMCLQSYWGLKRGMPWAMKGLNAQENYYEISDLWDMALQTWYTQHYRFVPTYMNWTCLQEKGPGPFETNLLLCISSSVHAQMGASYAAIENPENKAAFRKWIDFANGIRPYLARRRCLFGQPGSTWITGSAHCIGDRGYLFLFRMRDPDAQPAYAMVPLSELIGLTEGERFRVTQVHPQQGEVAGVFSRGESVPFAVTNQAEVYAIEATEDAASWTAPEDLATADQVAAFTPGTLFTGGS